MAQELGAPAITASAQMNSVPRIARSADRYGMPVAIHTLRTVRYGDPGPAVWMLYAGILLYGVCYDFFFVTGQIYVDTKAPKDLRTAAQRFIAFVTLDVGGFIGSWLSGRVVDVYVVAGDGIPHQWESIRLIPAAWTTLVLVLFAVFFTHPDDPDPAAEARTAA